MARKWINPISGDLSRLEAAQKLNRFDLAKFHYFNKNGINAEWTKLGDDILAAADAGKCKNGAWLAYGPIGYYDKRLRQLTNLKQFKVVELISLLNCIQDTIQKGRKFLADLD